MSEGVLSFLCHFLKEVKLCFFEWGAESAGVMWRELGVEGFCFR
ncbi:MAG: hypothetical protein Q4C96_10580 [Planctomycetia bacterium]|nr:hypothetical protein [Planctomycetia bacterium]